MASRAAAVVTLPLRTWSRGGRRHVHAAQLALWPPGATPNDVFWRGGRVNWGCGHDAHVRSHPVDGLVARAQVTSCAARGTRQTPERSLTPAAASRVVLVARSGQSCASVQYDMTQKCRVAVIPTLTNVPTAAKSCNAHQRWRLDEPPLVSRDAPPGGISEWNPCWTRRSRRREIVTTATNQRLVRKWRQTSLEPPGTFDVDADHGRRVSGPGRRV